MRTNKCCANNLTLNLVILLVYISPVVLSLLMRTDGRITVLRVPLPISIGIPCFFKLVTGYNCPFCGMTRAFIYMSRMNIGAAWNMNRSGVLLYLFCIIQLPYRSLVIFTGKTPIHKYIKLFGYVYLIVAGTIALGQFAFQFI